MVNEGNDVGTYIRELRASTQRCAKDLLWENEKLLALALTLNAAKISLEEQVSLLRDEVDRRTEVHAVVIEQLTDAEESVRALSAGFIDAERANSNLSRLYAASRTLHRSLDREDVIRALEDIIKNHVGAKEFALFERTGEGERLAVIAQGGIDPERALDADAIEAIAMRGAIRTLPSSEAKAGRGPRVVIPLKVGEGVTGAIAIYRMLPDGDHFDWVTREIVELLSAHAGIALHASLLYARESARQEGG